MSKDADFHGEQMGKLRKMVNTSREVLMIDDDLLYLLQKNVE